MDDFSPQKPHASVLLRRWRERSLLTQEQLAERSGVAVRTIGRLEAGTNTVPRAESLRRIAEALDLTEAERRQLTEAICADPSLPTVPRQLPARMSGFAGREGELRNLDRARVARPGAPVVIAITGTAGVGKTTLATQWAHRIAADFPDGKLYADLHGFAQHGRAAEPLLVLRDFLGALGVAAAQLPDDVQARSTQLRTLLADRRVLIVLDNAVDEAQVRPLLPHSPGCLVVVTSRHELTGLVVTAEAHIEAIELPPFADAQQLLSNRIGAQRVTTEQAGAIALIKVCARLPLAIALAAAHAQRRPHQPLTQLVSQIEAGRLDALSHSGDTSTDVRAVFSWSYRSLPHTAQEIFRCFGLHPGPELSLTAIARMTRTSAERIRPMVRHLLRANLVNETTLDRFALHDLLRIYAGELADHEPEGTRVAIQSTMLTHYLQTADRAACLLDRWHEPGDAASPLAEPIDNVGQALAWFDSEIAVLFQLTRFAAASRFDRQACQLALTIVDYVTHRDSWEEHVALQEIALEAAVRLEDASLQARVGRALGRAYARAHQLPQARKHIELAMDLFRSISDEAGEASTYLGLGHLGILEHDFAAALRHSQRSLKLFRRIGHPLGEALAANAIGWCHTHLGDHRKAIRQCRSALSKVQEIGAHDMEGAILDSLGLSYRRLGDLRHARDCYAQAIPILHEVGHHNMAAITRCQYAGVLRELGRTDDARAELERALHHAATDEATRSIIHTELDLLG